MRRMRRWTARKILIHAALEFRNPIGALLHDEFVFRCICGQSIWLAALAAQGDDAQEGPDKCTGADMRIMGEAADRIEKLERELAEARRQPEGLSKWAGWDQSNMPWTEAKHKDRVCYAAFGETWSMEDAHALISFIDRTWGAKAQTHSETRQEQSNG